jgi:hypothetical protein
MNKVWEPIFGLHGKTWGDFESNIHDTVQCCVTYVNINKNKNIKSIIV